MMSWLSSHFRRDRTKEMSNKIPFCILCEKPSPEMDCGEDKNFGICYDCFCYSPEWIFDQMSSLVKLYKELKRAGKGSLKKIIKKSKRKILTILSHKMGCEYDLSDTINGTKQFIISASKQDGMMIHFICIRNSRMIIVNKKLKWKDSNAE